MGFDIAIIVIIIAFIVLGAKNGAGRTLLKIVGTILSVVLSFVICNPLAQGIYNSFFKPGVIKNISDSINTSGVNSVTKAVNDVINSLPQYVMSVFKYFGVDSKLLNDSLTNAVSQSPQGAANIIEKVISPVFIALISLILFLLFFIIISIGIGLLTKLLCNVLNLPIIKQVNKFAGGILGILQGVLVVFLLVTMFKFTAPMFNNLPNDFNNQINNTYIFKYFYNLDLLKENLFYNIEIN